MTRIVSIALLLFAALFVAACGSDSDSGDAKDGEDNGVQLAHVDGPITLAGDEVTVTPATGDGPETFELGPAVKQGSLQALVASKARARVFYDAESGDSPVAVSVVAAPTIDANAQYYDGEVTRIADDQIAIKGSDGVRTFAIRAAEREAFDIEHLEEHKREGEPVRLYYVGQNAVAYEDA